MIKKIFLFLFICSCGFIENKEDVKKTTQTTGINQETNADELPDYSDLTLEVNYVNSFRNESGDLMSEYTLIVKGENISNFTHYRVIDLHNSYNEEIDLHFDWDSFTPDEIFEELKNHDKDLLFGFYDSSWQKIEKQNNPDQLNATLNTPLYDCTPLGEFHMQFYLKDNEFNTIKAGDDFYIRTGNRSYKTTFDYKAKNDFPATIPGNIINFKNNYYLINCNGAFISENLNKWKLLQSVTNEIIDLHVYQQRCNYMEIINLKKFLTIIVEESSIENCPARGESYQVRFVNIRDFKIDSSNFYFDKLVGSSHIVLDNKILFLGGAEVTPDGPTSYSHFLKGTSEIALTDLDLKNEKTLESKNKFPARFYHQIFRFNEKYLLIGGEFHFFDDKDVIYYKTKKYNDIWSSSDLINWEKVVDKLPFDANENRILVIFNDQIWTIKSGKIWQSQNGKEWQTFKKWEFLKNEQLINLFSENNKIHIFTKIDEKYFHYQAGTDLKLGKKVEMEYKNGD